MLAKSCGQPAATSNLGSFDAAAGRHGPTLQQYCSLKPQRLIYWQDTGESVPSSRPFMLLTLPLQHELLICRMWQTNKTTVSTGSGSSSSGVLWGERHHQYQWQQTPIGLRRQIEWGYPTGGTIELVYFQAVRHWLPHHVPRGRIFQVCYRVPMVFQVKKTWWSI